MLLFHTSATTFIHNQTMPIDQTLATATVLRILQADHNHEEPVNNPLFIASLPSTAREKEIFSNPEIVFVNSVFLQITIAEITSRTLDQNNQPIHEATSKSYYTRIYGFDPIRQHHYHTLRQIFPDDFLEVINETPPRQIETVIEAAKSGIPAPEVIKMSNLSSKYELDLQSIFHVMSTLGNHPDMTELNAALKNLRDLSS